MVPTYPLFSVQDFWHSAEKKWFELPWQKVREAAEVKLFTQKGELYVWAKSAGGRAQERAIRQKKRARLLGKLRALRRSGPRRDPLWLRIGAARKEAGGTARFVQAQVPREGEAVTRAGFRFQVDQAKLKAAELQDGQYLLRSNLVEEDPAVLWERYIQLTQIEAAFKALKSELGLRPIYHPLAHRVEAHIVAAFLAYCLQVTWKNRLQVLAPGLTPKRPWTSWLPFQCWMSICPPPRGVIWFGRSTRAVAAAPNHPRGACRFRLLRGRTAQLSGRAPSALHGLQGTSLP